jgi:hypothetical protein
MSEPQPDGPFVEISPGLWVNSLHVAAVEGIGRGDSCWVTTTYSGEDSRSFRVEHPPQHIIGSLVQALIEYEQERGEAQERGRLEVLSEDERNSEDAIRDAIR